MKSTFSGQKKIKDLVYNILGPTLKQQGWFLSKLMLNWESIVGQDIKNHLWPSRFANTPKNRSAGVLWLKASPKGMQYLLYNKGMLAEKINLYLGQFVVLDLKAKLWQNKQTLNTQASNSTPELTPVDLPSLTNIQDETLKQALHELGAWVNK